MEQTVKNVGKSTLNTRYDDGSGGKQRSWQCMRMYVLEVSLRIFPVTECLLYEYCYVYKNADEN